MKQSGAQDGTQRILIVVPLLALGAGEQRVDSNRAQGPMQKDELAIFEIGPTIFGMLAHFCMKMAFLGGEGGGGDDDVTAIENDTLFRCLVDLPSTIRPDHRVRHMS